MNARLLSAILLASLLAMLALPGMGWAAPLAVAPADHVAASTKGASAQVAISAAGAVKCPSVYRVRFGETLASIAARCGVTTTAIVKANGLRSTRVWPGQRLYIPAPTTTLTKPQQRRPPSPRCPNGLFCRKARN